MMQDHPTRRRRCILLACALVSTLAIFVVPNPISWRLDQHIASSNTLQTSNLDLINNGTLGFGAIYALSLPERSDKQDSLQLAAALTGLQITWINGIHGEEMHPKAIPPAHDDPNAGVAAMRSDGALGCWRGHMNAIRDIVAEGLSSALIIEDDADWDIHIVEQMQQFALAADEVLTSRPAHGPGQASYHMSDSPYGKDWDILWLGHCGGWAPHPKYQKLHSIIRGDATVPPAFDSIEVNWSGERNGLNWPYDSQNVPSREPDERIVQYNARPLCTTGYAVSQRGARKMLANLGGSSLLDVDEHVDVEMTDLCSGERDTGHVELMRCIIPSPPYFNPHKPRGVISGDSDREDISNTEIREAGVSTGLVWSTRLNVKNLAAGLEPESQYVQNADNGEWRYKLPEEYGLR